MILHNSKQEFLSLGIIKSKRYKITCHFDNAFHIKFILCTDQRVIDITENIYSDEGIYKFKFRFPSAGELFIKQSLDRANEWDRLDYNIKELDE